MYDIYLTFKHLTGLPNVGANIVFSNEPPFT